MRAWKSGLWAMSGQCGRIVLTFGTLAVLGRLLTPGEFGVFGLVLVVKAIIQPIIDMGLQPVYIKAENPSIELSDTFFTINLMTATTIAFLLVSTSPTLSLYYNSPTLKYLLFCLPVYVFFTAISGQPKAILSREHKFDLIVKANLIALAIGSALAIVSALYGFGVWALLIKLIMESIFNYALLKSYAFRKFRIVSFSSMKNYREEIKFGVEILSSRLLTSFTDVIDKVILGKFISLEVFGGYTRSLQYSLLPDANIRTALSTPALTYLTKKTSVNKIEAYLQFNFIIMLIAGTPCLLMMIHGNQLLPLIMGDQWSDFGWMLQWLSVYGYAMLFRGLLIIYNMDNRIVKITNTCLLGFIALVLCPSLIFFWVSTSIHVFVITLSVSALLYWNIASVSVLVKQYPNKINIIIKENIKTIITAAISVAVCIYLKESLGKNHAVLTLLVNAILIILINLSLNAKKANTMLKMVKEK